MNWAVFAIGLVMVAFAIRDSLKNKKILPVIVTLSGVFCVIPEVFIKDIWSGHIKPASFDEGPFQITGNDMTWSYVVTWFAFGTAVTMICYTLISGNVKTKWLWTGLAVAVMADIIFEGIVINRHNLYVYYDFQPFLIWTGFPWWKMTTSTTSLFLSAAIAFRYRELLDNWLSVLMFAITPVSYFAVHGVAGTSALLASKGNYSWSAGILICALCMIIAALTMQFILKRDPANPEGKNFS